MKVALLDLDETLIEEHSAAVAAFEATAAFAETADQRLTDRARLVTTDVEPALSELREGYALGLVTNGASCLRHEKLDHSGLRPFFDVVVVSAEFGTGKPDASIFRYELSRLAEPHEQAVMLGDSLSRDMDDAVSAGLQAIWVNRLGHPRPADLQEVIDEG